MTKNVPSSMERKMRRLLAEKRMLHAQKELLTALCLMLVMALGLVLILI